MKPRLPRKLIRMSLRRKLMFFSVLIAVMPLLIAGQSLIRIARDEMESSANEMILTTAGGVSSGIDDIYERAWLAPLLLIRNAIDGEELGMREKIAVLVHGISDLPDVVALQLSIEGGKLPLVASRQAFSGRLGSVGLDPLSVLRINPDRLFDGSETTGPRLLGIDHIPETDDWLATLVLPLKSRFGDANAVLSARIDLKRVREFVDRQPFRANGVITIVDATGRQVFDAARPDLRQRDIVRRALAELTGGGDAISVEAWSTPNGTAMLGTVDFVHPLNWAILVEKREDLAYYAVYHMIRSLGIWLALGLTVALAGSVAAAVRISRPILAIGDAVTAVGQGDFKAQVRGVRSRDEIGELAWRINEMIRQINERFHLTKFVSTGTMEAIRASGHEGVRLGGLRREVTILFADIRGYTAFAESRDPETVVEVLNYYLQRQADLVAAHNGDIDKFVGDQIMAVFQGPDMAADAVRCAVAIQAGMAALVRHDPDWDLSMGIGIDVGEVVMGAIGSKDRMDFTVLGDRVNLAARLCSHARGRQTLISQAVALKTMAKPPAGIKIRQLPPITVKGKTGMISVFEANAATLPTIQLLPEEPAAA